MEPVLLAEIVKLASSLVTNLILAGRREEAEAIAAILGRAGVNFGDLVEWSERP